MSLFIWIIIFIASLAVLVKSSDYFTDSSEKIGVSLGIPRFIVGVMIISVGTSLPELLTAVFGVVSGSSEIAISNVVGSNITNLFLGMGLIALIMGRSVIKKNIISVDLPILIGSVLIVLMTCIDGSFTWLEAIICLVLFGVYIGYALSEHKDYKMGLLEKGEILKKPRKRDIVILVVSCFFLYLGAKYTVDSVIALSVMLGIGTTVITASALALGTSLPEIVTSAVAAKKGKTEMAIGTLLGSNIFNALAIMGFSGLFGTLLIPPAMITFGIPMLVLSTLLYYFVVLDNEITKWEGLMLITFYVVFIVKLLGIF